MKKGDWYWVIALIPMVLYYLGVVRVSMETYIKFVLGAVILVEVLGMLWMWVKPYFTIEERPPNPLDDSRGPAPASMDS